MELKVQELTIALAGNPNVGKSTVFNSLTGMHQHTGNWSGKTVSTARGTCEYKGQKINLVDLPGTYSLTPHSAEEEVARDFLAAGDSDCVIIVCDATCLERNLHFVLQVLELTDKAVICLNLMDEAKRKGIHIKTKTLAKRLGVPVIPVTARKGKGLDQLLEQAVVIAAADALPTDDKSSYTQHPHIQYPYIIEEALTLPESLLAQKAPHLPGRWLALRWLEQRLPSQLLSADILLDPELDRAAKAAWELLEKENIDQTALENMIVSTMVQEAENIYKETVHTGERDYNEADRRLDRIFTGKNTGYPIMLLLLALVLWITISGANYPSRLLSDLLFGFQDKLTDLFMSLQAPAWLHGALVLGVYRVMAWVVSVMLPPMAIFFPLFTLLEDAGYLPRVAYNMDKHFQKCHACGKQCLTMLMGFGCNAVGVTGCRIIDSPRERLIAVLTNCFVPCNGRFPALLSIITVFFVGLSGGIGNSLLSALLLTAAIVFSILMTFAASRFLSATVLKGVPSAFTLELPPYRRPQIAKTLIRSLCDRTLFVLGRAAKAAAPAGLLIWILANVQCGDTSLLQHISSFLDPFGRLLGMDGIILMAFILGAPANEIVLPIIIMGYTCGGTLVETGSLLGLQQLLLANGWTWITACCTVIFFLLHWPCATTIMTIKKETGSIKWTLLSILLPTLWGMSLCFLTANIARLFC